MESSEIDDTVLSLKTFMVVDQFLSTVNPELRLYIKDRSPQSVQEMNRHAGSCAAARQKFKYGNKLLLQKIKPKTFILVNSLQVNLVPLILILARDLARLRLKKGKYRATVTRLVNILVIIIDRKTLIQNLFQTIFVYIITIGHSVTNKIASIKCHACGLVGHNSNQCQKTQRPL